MILEFYNLPKLRKENLYVESDLNTPLQTYLYDFLYDQQDLYDYYDSEIKESNQSSIIQRNTGNSTTKNTNNTNMNTNNMNLNSTSTNNHNLNTYTNSNTTNTTNTTNNINSNYNPSNTSNSNINNLNSNTSNYSNFPNYKTSDIKVKSDSLPFADSLENIGEIIQEFKSPNSKLILNKLRWYLLDEDLVDQLLGKTKNCLNLSKTRSVCEE